MCFSEKLLRDSLSHPGGVAFGQFGHEEDGSTRVDVDGAIAVRLDHSERPVEERLLYSGTRQESHSHLMCHMTQLFIR